MKGDIAADGPMLVRMHALNLLDDILGDRHNGKAGELHQAMRMIGAAGRGVIVLIREFHPTSLSDRLRARIESARGERARSCATTASARRSCSISASRR